MDQIFQDSTLSLQNTYSLRLYIYIYTIFILVLLSKRRVNTRRLEQTKKVIFAFVLVNKIALKVLRFCAVVFQVLQEVLLHPFSVYRRNPLPYAR